MLWRCMHMIMQICLHPCVFFILQPIGAIFALQDLSNGDDLFAIGDSFSDSLFFDDSNPELVAWNTDNGLADGGGGEPSLFAPDLALRAEGSDDETDIFLTASCSSATDTLKARGDSQTPASSCPSTGGLSFPVPQLPTTLDEFTNQLPPTNEGKKEPGLDLVPDSWWPSPLPLASSDENDPTCPRGYRYRVCCLCNRPFAYAWCHDCLLSRFFLSTFFSIYRWRTFMISSVSIAPAYL